MQYVVAQYTDLRNRRTSYKMPLRSAKRCFVDKANDRLVEVIVGWMEGLGPVQGDPTNPARSGREQR